MAIRHVQSPTARDGMGFDRSDGGDAVFPFLLHFGVHDQETVVWEVDGDLTLFVSESFVAFGYDATDSELSCDSLGGC